MKAGDKITAREFTDACDRQKSTPCTLPLEMIALGKQIEGLQTQISTPRNTLICAA